MKNRETIPTGELAEMIMQTTNCAVCPAKDLCKEDIVSDELCMSHLTDWLEEEAQDE